MSKGNKKKFYKTNNTAPGTVTYIGNKQSDNTHIEIISYNENNYSYNTSKNIEDAFHLEKNEQITWVNINGLSNTKEIEKLGKHYNIHALVLEDVVNTNQRAKLEEYSNYLFIVFKMLHINQGQNLLYEHLSLIVGKNYVITFQEADGDVFDSLRDRIKNANGLVRQAKADYLMYAILDAVVDHYFTAVQAQGDKVEELEELLFSQQAQSQNTPNYIQAQKRELLKIRRSIYPFREVVSKLENSEFKYIEEKTKNYIRNLYDHMIQVNESIELYREMTWGLMDLHMTNTSNKMNEVMKVLTIIATIFIPLTFIAGIYGMNFTNMPELHYKNAYYIVLLVMFFIFIFMLIYFRKKKWI